jgi:hypothetical protein
MTRGQANFLRAFSIWTAFVWFTFIKNVVGVDDRSTGFKVVHVGLAIISLAFAAGCWILVSRARRSAMAKGSTVSSAATETSAADETPAAPATASPAS